MSRSEIAGSASTDPGAFRSRSLGTDWSFRKLVNQSLEELPVALREVLVMRELEDLSYKEIAEIANIPIGTVMSRLSRGRAMLRATIETRMRKAG